MTATGPLCSDLLYIWGLHRTVTGLLLCLEFHGLLALKKIARYSVLHTAYEVGSSPHSN